MMLSSIVLGQTHSCPRTHGVRGCNLYIPDRVMAICNLFNSYVTWEDGVSLRWDSESVLLALSDESK